MLPEESLDDALARAQAETAASFEYIRSLGIEIPTHILEFSLSEWLTAKRYASEHGMLVEEVEDWVKQGVIPVDCTMVIPEIHNIRLVKNCTYK
jgi:hypothetical protein